MDALASQTRIHTSVHRKRRARGKEREKERERENVEVGAYRYMRVQQRQMAPSLRERSREKDDIDHSERVQHETCTAESASRGRAHVRKGRTRCNGATVQRCNRVYTHTKIFGLGLRVDVLIIAVSRVPRREPARLYVRAPGRSYSGPGI